LEHLLSWQYLVIIFVVELYDNRQSVIVICHCSPPLPLFLAISTIIDGPDYHNYRDHDFTGAAAEEVLWSNAWVHEAMNLHIQWTELEAMVLWMKMSSGGD